MPLAFAFDGVTLVQLYVVALLTGAASVLFNTTYPSFFILLVDRADYLDANSKLSASRSASFVAGPALGGALVQALSAPVALFADAVSFLVVGAAHRPDRHHPDARARSRRGGGRDARDAAGRTPGPACPSCCTHPVLRGILGCCDHGQLLHVRLRRAGRGLRQPDPGPVRRADRPRPRHRRRRRAARRVRRPGLSRRIGRGPHRDHRRGRCSRRRSRSWRSPAGPLWSRVGAAGGLGVLLGPGRDALRREPELRDGDGDPGPPASRVSGCLLRGQLRHPARSARSPAACSPRWSGCAPRCGSRPSAVALRALAARVRRPRRPHPRRPRPRSPTRPRLHTPTTPSQDVDPGLPGSRPLTRASGVVDPGLRPS